MAKRQRGRIGPADIRRYAAVGAEARLQQLQAEIERIRRAFPELGKGTHTAAAPQSSAAGAQVPRRKRTMSVEARERIGAAQRARWARQKAAGGTEARKKR
jgi:hypothetical protein